MQTAILWFRRNLRLADNPVLAAARAHCQRLLPVYIHAPEEEAPWEPGPASGWWLYHSLNALNASLQRRGSVLVLRRGPSLSALLELVGATGARAVYWDRLYDPPTAARDQTIRKTLADHGVAVTELNAGLLREPWSVVKGDGTPYRVFTAYWRAVQHVDAVGRAAPAPRNLPPPPDKTAGLALDTLEPGPVRTVSSTPSGAWAPGEAGAGKRLRAFLRDGLDRYRGNRDRPDLGGTSRLSPHLHFGEISPRQIWNAVEHAHTSDTESHRTAFLRQLGWREFAYNLLHYFPHTPDQPLDERFVRFRWADDYHADLHRWKEGRTGIPIVDAGMRELLHTGWMHNRVRMVVASFLTKNLLVPWTEGARWFWEGLVDADLANNTLGWQWVAGCGADAAPYFRIFNPIIQGERFDPEGTYVRRWVPELAKLPDSRIHKPWTAHRAGAGNGDHTTETGYPSPMVSLSGSRQRALARFQELKKTRR